MMNSIPYELLQLISSNLLPRYQCRLALTSRHCYKYIYNDLLRWHAQKDAILAPKHKILFICKDIRGIGFGSEGRSLLCIGNNVIKYEFYRYPFRGYQFEHVFIFSIINLSTICEKFVYEYGTHTISRRSEYVKIKPRWVYDITYNLRHYLVKREFRAYLHKDVILALINMRSVPYFEFNERIGIQALISRDDIRNMLSCTHLRGLFIYN